MFSKNVLKYFSKKQFFLFLYVKILRPLCLFQLYLFKEKEGCHPPGQIIEVPKNISLVPPGTILSHAILPPKFGKCAT